MKFIKDEQEFLKNGADYRKFLASSIYDITGKAPSMVQSKMHFREQFLKKSLKVPGRHRRAATSMIKNLMNYNEPKVKNTAQASMGTVRSKSILAPNRDEVRM